MTNDRLLNGFTVVVFLVAIVILSMPLIPANQESFPYNFCYATTHDDTEQIEPSQPGKSDGIYLELGQLYPTRLITLNNIYAKGVFQILMIVLVIIIYKFVINYLNYFYIRKRLKAFKMKLLDPAELQKIEILKTEKYGGSLRLLLLDHALPARMNRSFWWLQDYRVDETPVSLSENFELFQCFIRLKNYRLMTLTAISLLAIFFLFIYYFYSFSSFYDYQIETFRDFMQIGFEVPLGLLSHALLNCSLVIMLITSRKKCFAWVCVKILEYEQFYKRLQPQT